MKTPLLLCLLSALLEKGTCVSCEVCVGIHDSCTGSVRVCSAGEDSCGIFKTETVIGELKSPTFVKACLSSSICSVGPAFMTFGNGISVSTNVACCGGRSCQTASVIVPPANTTLNGHQCSACYSVFSHHCTEEIIDCTGAQTQCIHFSGTVKSGGTTVHITMKGCATESACTNLQQLKEAIGGISNHLTTAECNPASHAASTAPGPARLVLPALGIVLLAHVLS